MNDIILKIKDKTYKAQPYELQFGVICKVMALLKVETMTSSLDMLTAISQAWDEVVKMLSTVFPDVTADEWNNVGAKEVIRVVMEIVKYSVKETLSIPAEKN